MRISIVRLVAAVTLLSLNTPVFAGQDTTWAGSGLPEAQVSALQQALRQHGIPRAVQQDWQQRADQLHAQGIPTDLLGARLLEGLAKNIPTPVIDRAVATLSHDLVWAQGMLVAHSVTLPRDTNNPELVQALAQMEGALRAGLSRSDLSHIYGTAPATLDQITAVARLGADVAGANVASSAVVTPLQDMLRARWTAARINRTDGPFMADLARGQSGPAVWAGIVASDLPRTTPSLSTELRRSLCGPGSTPMGGPGSMGTTGPMGGAGSMPSMPMSPMGGHY